MHLKGVGYIAMNSSRVVLINIIVVLLLIGGGATAVYYYTQSINYIATDNARIDGQPISIASPSAGQLTDWHGEVGKSFSSGDRIGTVRAAAGSVDITFPVSGTVVQQSAVINTIIGAGVPLARAFDLSNLWVTANITETNINDVKINQAVDVYLDAYSGTALTGKVTKIGLATAGTFSLLPVSNTSSNYTKVIQVIPITISLDGYRGLGLVPGMSASIRIHK
jgi:multidrug resistance efflux pump